MSGPQRPDNFEAYQDMSSEDPPHPGRPSSTDSWERPRSPSLVSKYSVSSSKYSQHSPNPAPSSPTLTSYSKPEGGLGDKPESTGAGTAVAERVWPSHQESGGHRTEPTLIRGIWSTAGSGASQWLLAIQVILQYEFTNPDLLEEALESPGSGVNCVGKSHRHFSNGNKGLANVGEMVMKLVLTDQCYLFKIPDGDASNILEKLIGRKNLAYVCWKSKIEKFVRRKKPLRPTKRKNILFLMKDDASREDPSRTAARAMRAIVGAVYYDGGLQAARRVIAELGLIIKPGLGNVEVQVK
ncbi:Ribonuclease III domain containing protein [Hyaloscypha variabilis]